MSSNDGVRCPECGYLVTEHANGQRPDSTARIMRGCELTEEEACDCYALNEILEEGGWPAVIRKGFVTEAEARRRERIAFGVGTEYGQDSNAYEMLNRVYPPTT